MYKVIGADGKEYGPVSADQIRQWIAERRLIAQSKVQAEGSAEWRALAEFPEFADALAAQPPPTQQPYIPPSAAPTLGAEILARDYYLDIGACISNGFDLLKNNFGLLVCAVLIYGAIEIAIAGLSMIPFVGPLFSLGNIFVAGPLLGGLYYVFLKAIRKLPASAGQVFAGFSTRYWQLVLGNFIPGLLAALCFLPAVIFAFIVFLGLGFRHQEPSPVYLVIFLLAILVCMIPAVYLQTNWLFTLPLVIDRQLDFWSAMKASWKMVTKHWWRVFALALLTWILGIVGILFCGIGILVTAPIAIAALMYAYETIFNPAEIPGAAG